jgi:hypothetical protein
MVTVVITIMIFQFVPKAGNFLTKWVTINFPGKTMFHALKTFDTLSHSPASVPIDWN